MEPFISYLNNFNPLALAFIIIALLIVAFVWIIILNLKLRSMLVGKNLKNLEETFIEIQKQLKTLSSFKNSTENSLLVIEQKLRKSIRGIETLRFNPFKGTGSGGNQSFASAFLNEEGDGTIISSLYTRERVSVFAKPIKKFSSEFELTEEEKQVLDNAKKKTTV